MKFASSKAALLLFMMLMPAKAWATSDNQLWTTGSATVKLSDNMRFSQEIVGRFSDNLNGIYEIESKTMLGYRVSKVVTLWAGYTHDPQYNAGHFTVMEHRAREQVAFDNFARLGRGKLSGRLRLEERWREGRDGTGWRLRPYLKYSFPLHGKTALNLSTEPFINFNRICHGRVRLYEPAWLRPRRTGHERQHRLFRAEHQSLAAAETIRGADALAIPTEGIAYA